ncbi:MAG TPA: hypothetical protein VIK86_05725 [Candidatus Paceibacterota bacterium]
MLFKKKDKRFPLTEQGIQDMFKYEKDRKIKKINTVTYVVVIMLMFGLGILSKEIFMVMVANKGIGGITDIIFR